MFELVEDIVKVEYFRYIDFCEIYGEFDVMRRDEVNLVFLEVWLFMVMFMCKDK